MAAGGSNSSNNNNNNNTQLVEELEALTQSLFKPDYSSSRRSGSLALPRSSTDDITNLSDQRSTSSRPRSRRMSLSPWRSRPNNEPGPDSKKLDATVDSTDKKGIWNWKPIRALSHIGMQKLSCLFSVEVVTAQALPASMNGLRLSVCVRKKETRDGAVHTMPSRVSQGAADFEETLFLKSHVYCTPTNAGKHLKFEPRPFLIYVVAVDAAELEFGRSLVDLTHLIQESMRNNLQGTRIRQWDSRFSLSGKAQGGQLLLKLGFQIMEKHGGLDIYTLPHPPKSNFFNNLSSPSLGRTQSKTSFSVPSPRLPTPAQPWSPSHSNPPTHLQGIDDLNLDEPAPVPISQPPHTNAQDLDLPDFEVVDKGVEIPDRDEVDDAESEHMSVSSEVVKEMLHDPPLHLTRLTQLDSIAQQIKALESMMGVEKNYKIDEEETDSQRLDAEEESVTREFLQMLEHEGRTTFKFDKPEIPPPFLLEGADDSAQAESHVYLSDLGKGLGCVVQTRYGGYLVAMNPLDTVLARKDTPKLAMQFSKQLVLPSENSLSGFELLQRMAAVGPEELSSQILSLMPIDELMGKTAEQIAFEGIASAIIQGRNKQGASSSAARTIAAVKTMATAMNSGRKERISTGIWYLNENPLTADEILAFSLQKIEAMAVEALKIQAEMAEEAPFDVSPLKEQKQSLASAIPIETWINTNSTGTSNSGPGNPETIVAAVVIQLRDPMRRYEAVGGPLLALIQATSAEVKDNKYTEEKIFKVGSMHIGGLKVKRGGKKNMWDTERQRLTAMQWLVSYGLGKAPTKKGKNVALQGRDILWSISSRAMADMWLKPMRNPDVDFSR